MKRLLEKYADKMVSAGLAEAGAPLLGGLDAEPSWNREDPACAVLERVFEGMNINSLLFSEPAEPYRSIIEHLAGQEGEAIRPSDCETRTFLHDLPVVREFEPGGLLRALRRRKSAIVPGRGIVTWGMVSPEQAYIFYSSVCFACFVKFFSDYRADRKRGRITPAQRKVFEAAVGRLDPLPEGTPELLRGPFGSGEEVRRAIAEAGRLTVRRRLVDSFFGNISFLHGDVLHISQTASSLDELEGCIDPCPLGGASCAGITASSELTAHREVVRRTGRRAVLHGHPKFSVIMSMACDREGCEREGQCHIRCPEERFVEDIPIVPGEVGTGPFGLCHTLPPALEGRRGAIVYGHGLFTTGREDFNEAFASLQDVERLCRELYLRETAS